MNTGPLAPKADALTPSQLRISMVVKVFNCFDAMGRNINKQSQIFRATHFQQIHFFCNIFTRMENFIWQFLIFMGVGFTAQIWLKCKM